MARRLAVNQFYVGSIPTLGAVVAELTTGSSDLAVNQGIAGSIPVSHPTGNEHGWCVHRSDKAEVLGSNPRLPTRITFKTTGGG